MNYYGLPDKYQSLSLSEELVLLRVATKRLLEMEETGTALVAIEGITFVLGVQLSLNTLPLMTKEIFLALLSDVIRQRHGEGVVLAFEERIKERWTALDLNVDFDVLEMDALSTGGTFEAPASLSSPAPPSALTFSRYNVPEAIKEAAVGADDLHLLNEVAAVRGISAKVISIFCEAYNDPSVTKKSFCRIALSLVQMIKSLATTIKHASVFLKHLKDTVEVRELAIIAISVLQELGLIDLSEELEKQYHASVRGTRTLPGIPEVPYLEGATAKGVG